MRNRLAVPLFTGMHLHKHSKGKRVCLACLSHCSNMKGLKHYITGSPPSYPVTGRPSSPHTPDNFISSPVTPQKLWIESDLPFALVCLKNPYAAYEYAAQALLSFIIPVKHLLYIERKYVTIRHVVLFDCVPVTGHRCWEQPNIFSNGC